MIIGIGFDMVEVERMNKWAAKKEMVTRFFHPRELKDLEEQNKSTAHSLAVRFAAKEAFGKALGTGISGFSLTDVWIMSGPSGKPVLKTEGNAAKLLKAAGGERVHVSLSHEKSYAGAVVVIETGIEER